LFVFAGYLIVCAAAESIDLTEGVVQTDRDLKIHYEELVVNTGVREQKKHKLVDPVVPSRVDRSHLDDSTAL
jgi:hypothetical protein